MGPYNEFAVLMVIIAGLLAGAIIFLRVRDRRTLRPEMSPTERRNALAIIPRKPSTGGTLPVSLPSSMQRCLIVPGFACSMPLLPASSSFATTASAPASKASLLLLTTAPLRSTDWQHHAVVRCLCGRPFPAALPAAHLDHGSQSFCLPIYKRPLAAGSDQQYGPSD